MTPEDTERMRITDLLKTKSKITIGRDKACDVVLISDFASRVHAFIEKDDRGNYYITDNASTNGTYVNKKLITGRHLISPTDKIQIGRVEFTLLDNEKPASSKVLLFVKNNRKLIELLSQKNSVTIGRSPEADIIIKDNIVSRKHARVFKSGNKYYIEDLNSTNGVFVNGKKVKGKTVISFHDEIRIGFHLFKLNADLNEDVLEKNRLTAIRAESITKKYDHDFVGLHPMSFTIPARCFVAIMGPSGCGKTTLMNILNGANPATSGKVYIHGLELSHNFELLKQKIGYVPQDDIVHKELTVNQSLFYAAKLKMNKDTKNEEIWERIDEVCKNLNIDEKEIRENKVKNLSGGQRKRVSIAVELLNNPSILFLDEPTSPLDPETIDGFLKSIKELTVLENTTVIMVTHKPTDIPYTDRIIFLAKRGYPAYYGNEKNIYTYFGLSDENIIDVYSALSRESKLEEWYKKWQEAHQPVEVKEDPSTVKTRSRYSLIRQYFWLTGRYARIKLNDKANMLILMAQPLIIPLALIYIFSELRIGVLFLMAVSAIWFGISNAAKEIVEEMPIYTRERMFNLNIISYLFSKITILSLIALIQIILFVLILKFRFTGDEIKLVNIPHMIVFMFYLAFSATLLGLLLSVLFRNSQQVMSIIPIILIPQIIFAGVIANIDTKDKELLSYIMLSRWGTEGIARIQNDYPAYETAAYAPDDAFLINMYGMYQKIKIESVCQDTSNREKPFCKTDIKSVYEKVPLIHASRDTMIVRGEEKPVPLTWQKGYRTIKANPLKILGFYENPELFNIFNSLKKNILAITILNILTFVLLYIFLKKKDKI